MNRAQIIDYYIQKSLEENFQIDQIRKELEANHIPDEEIKVIVKIVDNEIQRKILSNSSSKKFNELVYVGLVLAILGAGVTIGTFLGIINTGNSFIIAYGPFLGGVSIFLTGLAKGGKGSSGGNIKKRW